LAGRELTLVQIAVFPRPAPSAIWLVLVT